MPNNWRLTLHAVSDDPSQNVYVVIRSQRFNKMSIHNVRVRAKGSHGYIKRVNKKHVDVRQNNLNRFTKIVLEKQALRQRYIQLMSDAERAVGRKEAIYLLRDAEIIWQKINS